MRRSKLIRGNEGVPGNPGIAMMGSQVAPALHITEDTSRRSREHRAELLRFMKEVRKVHNDFNNITLLYTFISFLEMANSISFHKPKSSTFLADHV